MKRVIALLLALVMCLSLCACGQAVSGDAAAAGSSEPQTSEAAGLDFPLVGLWQNEGLADRFEAYLRIQEDGTFTSEDVMRSSSTFNGVTTSSASLNVTPGTWVIQDGLFMYNGMAPYEMNFDGTAYRLIKGNTVYIRVGEVDQQIELNPSGREAAEPAPYTVGTPIIAEGVEITLTECGFSPDIRITSRSGGFTMTSGPSPEQGKQFFYLKGLLKYTGKQSAFPAIGGNVVIDGYEYTTRVTLISKDAKPVSKVEPLDEVYVLIYTAVPDELANSFTDGEMVFGFNNNLENVEIPYCDYLYSVKAVR